ncbi:hypothetical protein GALMADRAFT_147429 [Galerina marginata CBS 339.88]|uniref:Uncharacterized protein n=1 Tax=Galerina marginata (strain CBS 339.88) TaxID=685588 RepID=A0A067SJS4_GALM3|nr:hypothetical protein GALMADRAFT_147429 [Galerina marginata CBS 339.88]
MDDGGSEGEFEPDPGTRQVGPSISIWFSPPKQATSIYVSFWPLVSFTFPHRLGRQRHSSPSSRATAQPTNTTNPTHPLFACIDAISKYGRPLNPTYTQQHLNCSPAVFFSDFTVAMKCLLILVFVVQKVLVGKMAPSEKRRCANYITSLSFSRLQESLLQLKRMPRPPPVDGFHVTASSRLPSIQNRYFMRFLTSRSLVDVPSSSRILCSASCPAELAYRIIILPSAHLRSASPCFPTQNSHRCWLLLCIHSMNAAFGSLFGNAKRTRTGTRKKKRGGKIDMKRPTWPLASLDPFSLPTGHRRSISDVLHTLGGFNQQHRLSLLFKLVAYSNLDHDISNTSCAYRIGTSQLVKEDTSYVDQAGQETDAGVGGGGGGDVDAALPSKAIFEFEDRSPSSTTS